jgi:hypothetical protein
MVHNVKVGEQFWAWTHSGTGRDYSLVKVEIISDREAGSVGRCSRLGVHILSTKAMSYTNLCNLFNIEDAVVERLRGYHEENCFICPCYVGEEVMSKK